MIDVSHVKRLGYHINGEFFNRNKARVVQEYRHIGEALVGNACDRARTLGQTVTIYQLPNGRWTHDKMKDEEPDQCLDTGQVYDNLISASLHMGATEWAIRAALDGRAETGGGYRWKALRPTYGDGE